MQAHSLYFLKRCQLLFFKKIKTDKEIFVTFLVSQAKKLEHYLSTKTKLYRFKFQDINPG